MLILGRKVNESIRIGDSILLKVIAIQEGQIKIGIEAPSDIKILRTEVYEQAVLNNRMAAAVQKDSVAALAKQLPSLREPQGVSLATVRSQSKRKS